MSQNESFEWPEEHLQDNASSARVERIWRNLEPNLGTTPHPPRRALPLAWAPALVVVGLAAGFFAGVRFPEPARESPKLVAEPPETEPAGPPELRAVDLSREEQPDNPQKRSKRRHPVRTRAAAEPKAEEAEDGEYVESLAPAPLSIVEGPPPAPPDWLTFADRGEYQRAAHALEDQGGFDAVLYGSSADELMILVDIARATGNRGRAVQALRRVTEQFPGDPNAPIATMMLGKLLMQAGDREGAAEAFSLYRRLSPQGDFAEDALANHFEAALEQGDVERARRLAKQYERDFPEGRSLEDIRAQLQAAEEALAADAGSPTDGSEADQDDPEEADRANPESDGS